MNAVHCGASLSYINGYIMIRLHAHKGVSSRRRLNTPLMRICMRYATCIQSLYQPV